MERRPDCVLLNTIAVAGRQSNSTTASDSTRNGKTIEVSLSLEHPPHPSILFVHSSDMNLTVPPNIVYTVDDLILLSVNMGSRPYPPSPEDCDFFVYRAHPTRPSLHLLRRPHPYFDDVDVGLLPRSDGQYTVAALIHTTITLDQYMYKLHLFHSDSEIQGWSCFSLPVDVPRSEFPVKIPRDSDRPIHWHLTTNVITIGGKRGTMGWVDLWRGILLCDVLDHKPSLRGVLLPVPLKELSYNRANGIPFGPGEQRRGIAFFRDDKGKGYLKLVHLEVSEVRLPHLDDETRAFNFRVFNWALTTWTNTKMTNSYEDWHQECMIQASDMRIDNPAVSQVLEASGLLMHRQPQDDGAAGERLALQNVLVSHPTLSVNGEDVVYLLARKKYMHPEAWTVAVDIKNGTVQAVEKFSDQRQLDSTIIYCLSIISKYMNPATTPAVGKGSEEWNDEASAGRHGDGVEAA